MAHIPLYVRATVLSTAPLIISIDGSAPIHALGQVSGVEAGDDACLKVRIGADDDLRPTLTVVAVAAVERATAPASA